MVGASETEINPFRWSTSVNKPLGGLLIATLIYY